MVSVSSPVPKTRLSLPDAPLMVSVSFSEPMSTLSLPADAVASPLSVKLSLPAPSRNSSLLPVTFCTMVSLPDPVSRSRRSMPETLTWCVAPSEVSTSSLRPELVALLALVQLTPSVHVDRSA